MLRCGSKSAYSQSVLLISSLGTATQTVEITGEPNRAAVIKTINHSDGNINEKTGDFPK